MDYPYIYRWHPFRGMACKVLVWGRGPVVEVPKPDWLVIVGTPSKPIRNNRLVEFEDGTRAIISGNALQKRG